jgi:hypothetical protein
MPSTAPLATELTSAPTAAACLDNRLDRFGCRGGNIAAHLVHSQHDALGNALGARDHSRATGPGRLQPVKNGDVTRGIGSNSATANQSAVGARVRDFVLVMYAFLSGVLA